MLNDTADTAIQLAPKMNNVFWGELTPCDHLVQIYQDDEALIDALEGFIAGGLSAGDAVVIIATPAHRASLQLRLKSQGFNLAAAAATNRYITLDADETLAKFMRNGWPDDGLFQNLVETLLARAQSGGRRVRAFGEMVAILWAQGNNGATVRLEHLWNRLCHGKTFSLFCAYPRSGFTQSTSASIKEIFDAHSRLVP